MAGTESTEFNQSCTSISAHDRMCNYPTRRLKLYRENVDEKPRVSGVRNCPNSISSIKVRKFAISYHSSPCSSNPALRTIRLRLGVNKKCGINPITSGAVLELFVPSNFKT